MEDGSSVRVRLTLDDKELFTDEVGIEDFSGKPKPSNSRQSPARTSDSMWRLKMPHGVISLSTRSDFESRLGGTALRSPSLGFWRAGTF